VKTLSTGSARDLHRYSPGAAQPFAMLKCSQALGYRSLSTETGLTISKHIYKLFIYFFSIFLFMRDPDRSASGWSFFVQSPSLAQP
jgi:hypothetical protein